MSSDTNFTTQKETEQALLRTAERLETLLKIESGILRAESPRAIADFALEHMERIIPSKTSAINLFQNQQSEVVTLSGRNTLLKPGDITPAAADQVEARKRGEALLIDDVAALPKKSTGMQKVLQRGGRSLLSVPMLAQGELVGTLTLIGANPGAFSPEDIKIARQVGNSVAIAIHNSHLLEREKMARHEAEMLREVAGNISASLSQKELLQLILSQLERVLPYDRATIFLKKGDKFAVTAHHGLEIQLPEQFPQAGDIPKNILTIINEQQPLIIADTENDPNWTVFAGGEFIRCWLGVPLATKENVVGLLMLDKKQPHFYRNEDAVMALAFANHAAVAIENANLYREIRQYAEVLETRVAERTRELGALYEITAISSQHMELQSALDRMISRISATMDSTTVTIQILNEAGTTLSLAAQQGLSPPMIDYMRELPADNMFMDKILSGNAPYLLKEAQTDPRLLDVPIQVPVTFSVATPIHARAKVLGVLGIAVVRPQPPSREDIALLTSIADQIGITIDNARLRQQSEQLAVLEERERLARDLHDSATQSLFSLTLFAAAAREHLASGQLKSVQKQLVELETTAVQTHKEMRLLLYELRPTVLEQEGLEEALRQRLQMVEFRSGIRGRITTNLSTKLPVAIEAVLFQVANEALNNTLKHSGADTVSIDIVIDDSLISMDIRDNGEGFSPGNAGFNIGMGLDIMHKRIQELDGSLQFESQPQTGTTVSVRIPLDPKDGSENG